MMKNYTKIVFVTGNLYGVNIISDNPAYEKEFDRLDAQGMFSASEIIDKLDGMGIRSYNVEEKCPLSLKDISLAELYDLLEGMTTEDLTALLTHTLFNSVVQSLIEKLLLARKQQLQSNYSR